MNKEFSFLLPDTQLPEIKGDLGIKEAEPESVEQLDRNVLSDSDIEELLRQEPLPPNQSPTLPANETEDLTEEEQTYHAEY